MGNEVGKPLTFDLKSSDIAHFLKTKFYGQDIQIKTVRSFEDISENSLVFSKEKVQSDLLKRIEHVCFITHEIPDDIGSNAFVVVDNPRLAFAMVLSEFFVEKKAPGIGQHSYIHPSAKISPAAIIGNGCSIGQNVEIGDHTEIRHNVTIADGVKIGRHCLIKSNTVIGEKGFGFDFEKDGTPVELPHLKSVILGDNVEIGAINTIAGGTLKNTIIHSHVKTDDHVHIAHNCIVGSKTIITACSEISGSVTIGENCWLGPNCSIMNKIRIGDSCLIGLGAVVLKDVPSGSIMAGNPATLIRMQEKNPR